MNIKPHFSSTRDDWETPQDIFNELNSEFGFTLDVCASIDNAKCASFYTIADDGLVQDWSGDVCWMNPPYGRSIGAWMEKAYTESKAGAAVVCLIPSRTDTRWWHDYAMKGEVRFIRGRLRFSGHKNNAPFPSAVIIFR